MSCECRMIQREMPGVRQEIIGEFAEEWQS